MYRKVFLTPFQGSIISHFLPRACALGCILAPLCDYAHFTQTLTQLISKELGLRGFTLTLAVEKAGTIDALREVANKALDQIRDRKGLPAAELARRSLFGN